MGDFSFDRQLFDSLYSSVNSIYKYLEDSYEDFYYVHYENLPKTYDNIKSCFNSGVESLNSCIPIISSIKEDMDKFIKAMAINTNDSYFSTLYAENNLNDIIEFGEMLEEAYEDGELKEEYQQGGEFYEEFSSLFASFSSQVEEYSDFMNTQSAFESFYNYNEGQWDYIGAFNSYAESLIDFAQSNYIDGLYRYAQEKDFDYANAEDYTYNTESEGYNPAVSNVDRYMYLRYESLFDEFDYETIAKTRLYYGVDKERRFLNNKIAEINDALQQIDEYSDEYEYYQNLLAFYEESLDDLSVEESALVADLPPLYDDFWDFLRTTAADICGVVVGFTEGIASFVEGIADLAIYVAGGIVALGEFAFSDNYNWTNSVFDFAGMDLSAMYGEALWSGDFSKYAHESFQRGGAFYGLSSSVGEIIATLALTYLTCGVGTGAVQFFGSKAATIASTLYTGGSAFAKSFEKNYNALGLGVEGQDITFEDWLKLTGAATIDGGVSAITWFLTYGEGAKLLAGSGVSGLNNIGNAFAGNYGNALKIFSRSLMNGMKPLITEGSSAIIDSDYDYESALYDAFLAACTSVIYDTTIGKYLGNEYDSLKQQKAIADSLNSTPDLLASGYDTVVNSDSMEVEYQRLLLDIFNLFYNKGTSKATGKVVKYFIEDGLDSLIPIFYTVENAF